MLTERQKLIFQAIVENYIRSADPVGSRTIAKREDITFSSATVRNEMADLEEMGFLEQPHTSAGRIPSQKGYRFYVDHLIKPGLSSILDIEKLRRDFMEKIYEMEEISRQTALILSNITNYTAVVLGHEAQDAKLKHIQIVPLSEDFAVAVLVTNKGNVEHKTVKVPEFVSVYEIEKLVNIINAKLVGSPINELRERLYSELSSELKKHLEHYESILQALDGAFESEHDDRIYLGGMTNIMMQPEFRDVEKVKDILELFEQESLLIQLFSSSGDEGIHVRIGQENSIEAINDCSIITATYHLDGKPAGKIGILGPTRMNYGKVIGLLEYLTKDLSRALNQLYKSD